MYRQIKKNVIIFFHKKNYFFLALQKNYIQNFFLNLHEYFLN